MFSDPPTKFFFGMAEWYANEQAKTHGGEAEDYLMWAGKFIKDRLDYHNKVRNDFKPHPDFEQWNIDFRGNDGD